MKIGVIGATGATGRRVVTHALARGHFVTAVARHPERLASADRLSFVRGDVLSPGGLTGAFDGVEVVISCIGPEKNLSPGTLMSVGVASILTECKRAKVRRFIMQSGIGLSDGRELSWPNRFAVRVSGRIFTAAIIDKAVAERMTQKIDMEWVIVRPVVLADKPAKGHYLAGPSARVAPQEAYRRRSTHRFNGMVQVGFCEVVPVGAGGKSRWIVDWESRQFERGCPAYFAFRIMEWVRGMAEAKT